MKQCEWEVKSEESANSTIHFKDFKDWLQLASAFWKNKGIHVPTYDVYKTPEVWYLSSSFPTVNTA